MKLRIDAKANRWKISAIKCSGPVGLEKSSTGTQIFLMRWREGRSWVALFDSRIRQGANLLTFKDKRIHKRYEIIDRGDDWFEVNLLKKET